MRSMGKKKISSPLPSFAYRFTIPPNRSSDFVYFSFHVFFIHSFLLLFLLSLYDELRHISEAYFNEFALICFSETMVIRKCVWCVCVNFIFSRPLRIFDNSIHFLEIPFLAGSLSLMNIAHCRVCGRADVAL